MPASRVVTPQMSKVRELADQALALPEGLTLEYTALKCGSLAAAKSAARGFQVTFSALRAKTRRMAEQHQGHNITTRDTFINGPYDALACVKSELPNGAGWEIQLCRGYAIDVRYDVKDRATGKPLEMFDPNEQRLELLSNIFTLEYFKAQAEDRAFQWPWSEEDKRWIWAYKPETAAGYWETAKEPLPDYAPQAKPIALVNSNYDVASIPADEMFPDEEDTQ